MSNVVTLLCRPLRLSPAQKAVLMCLADYCHDDGKDWHSIEAVTAWTCLGKSTVIEARRALEAEGIIVVEKATGRRNTTHLQLHRIRELVPQDQSSSRTGPRAAPVQQMDPTGPAAGQPPVQQPDQPVQQPDPKHQEASVKHQRHVRRMNGDPQHFAEFYEAYPRKVGREEARKAFAKLAVDSDTLQQMLIAVHAQASRDDWRKDGGKYIPHPATWLSGKRWQDELPVIAGHSYIGCVEGRSANGVAL